MKHIVIVGGGFGGVVAARSLAKTPNVTVTLVSDKPTFRYAPALYRVATGYQHRLAMLPLADMLPKSVEFVQGKLSGLDVDERRIVLSNGKKISFDYLILSLGSQTSYFHIPGLPELSYGIKDAAAIRKLQKHLHDDLIIQGELDKNYVVVGGGPTGTELAASLAKYLRVLKKRHRIKRQIVRVELIEAADRVLPMLHTRLSAAARRRLRRLGVIVNTGKKVQAETATSLKVDGRSIPTHTVIWTAGTQNNEFFQKHEKDFQFAKNGRVQVDEQLRSDKHIFVIGDNANSTYGGLAQTAIHQAHYVARVIGREMRQRPIRAYKPRRPFSIIPVGHNWAVLQYGNFTLYGRLAGVMRKWADFIGYADVLGYRKSYKIWRQFDAAEETCVVCRSYMRERNPQLSQKR